MNNNQLFVYSAGRVIDYSMYFMCWNSNYNTLYIRIELCKLKYSKRKDDTN